MSDDLSPDEPEVALPPNEASAKRTRFVLLTAGGLVMWPLIILLFGGIPACEGFEQPAVQALTACPLAVSMLGDGIARAPIGFSCGNLESGGGSGNASWRLPVRGSRGSGVADVAAIESSGRWRIQSLELEVDGRRIDALRCGSIVTHEQIRPAAYAGTVASILGTPHVAVGDACTVNVSPGDEHWPCRVIVRCGSRTLYGAGTTGWTTCGPDVHGAFSVHDTDATPAGGDPTLDLRAADGEALLTDQTSDGAWAVSIRFPPAR